MSPKAEAIYPYLLSILRRGLQAIGLWLIQHGYLNGGQWESIVGGLATILSVEVFVWLAKVQENKKIMAALALPATSTMKEVTTAAADNVGSK